MRRALFTLAAMAHCAAALAQGHVSWLETVHDFGTFSESVGKVTGVMRFVNTGDSALLITRVQPTCGCTAGDFRRTPVMPGDTAAVTLTYTAIGRPGEFCKDVYVYTTGQPRRSVVSIKGKVIGSVATVSEQYPVAVGPLRLDRASIPLGDITRGKTRMAYISGYNTSTDSVRVAFSGVTAGIIPQALPQVVAPGSTMTVTVFYDSGSAPLWGLNTYSFGISATPLSGGEGGTVEAGVMAMVKEDFSRLTPKQRACAPVAMLEADRLDFGTVSRQSTLPVQRKLIVTNTGREPLLVRRAYSLWPGVTATVKAGKIKPGLSADIVVTVSPDKIDQAEKALNAPISVITNDPINPEQEVRAVGLLAP